MERAGDRGPIERALREPCAGVRADISGRVEDPADVIDRDRSGLLVLQPVDDPETAGRVVDREQTDPPAGDPTAPRRQALLELAGDRPPRGDEVEPARESLVPERAIGP